MKKGLTLAMTAALSVSLAVSGCAKKDTGGAGANAGTNAGGTAAPAKNVTLKIFQFKVEIAEALNKMKTEYESSHPGVTLQIETVGGGADYGAALKAKFASGDQPDIFNNGGYQEMATWMDHLEDLSDQPWVKNVLPVAKEPMSKDGKLYGMPMNVEGYGFLYNKDLFAKAGITEEPKTLSALQAACAKLQAAGIVPFSNGYQEWWVLGIHNFNVALAKQPDPAKFVADLYSGAQKIPGNPVFKDWLNLLDTTVKYSSKNPLTTDYNTQVTQFAKGETAMMQQGNWTQVQISGINPNIKLGVLPMPINDDPALNDKLFVGVPNNWVINKDSKVKAEAKEFLNWMVSSDVGQRYMTKEFKFIPAFTNISADPKDLGDIAAVIMDYNKANKVLPWVWARLPDGTTQEFGASMQAYIAGKMNKDQLLDAFQKSFDSHKTAAK
ncbi:ABC transporter substrate-binding protein [Gordoniibacillus kamchatkensis]|uniref:ABC transporter substrate-binding protein n=1 Tax=Gordoniibacillus kamchatkensis TaxID=1590651 RepID=A0ABR5ALK0_9BACL|nr:ABC transporter substrate-binding protein [Paenibacillus sp. VKM B-2647]KIL41859.1 ABC transporter substrate-binding protein [Paenibacillus sp. VKM B-2647]